jgi:hypothetical protein
MPPSVAARVCLARLSMWSLEGASNVTNHPAATRDCPLENARLRRSGGLECYLPLCQSASRSSTASIDPPSCDKKHTN